MSGGREVDAARALAVAARGLGAGAPHARRGFGARAGFEASAGSVAGSATCAAAGFAAFAAGCGGVATGVRQRHGLPNVDDSAPE